MSVGSHHRPFITRYRGGKGRGTLYMILLAMQNKIMKGTVQIAVLILHYLPHISLFLSC